MQFFVKAVEIWVPATRGRVLEIGSAYYGDLEDFEDASAGLSFAYDQGLPGKTWAYGRPIVLTDLENSYFQRGQAARLAGIACALSLPVFCGECLQAVAVFFCGGETDVIGAVEVWHNPDGSSSELRLADGFYGELERFEWVSRRLSIMRGRGLPGSAWEQGKPVVIDDLGRSSAFLRARNAAEVGITTGLAIPFFYTEADVRVLTFLSARGTPIARRFEIWIRDREAQVLRFDSGHCAERGDLAQDYAHIEIRKGEGPLGEAWLTGRPLVIGVDRDGSPATLIMLPVIRDCSLGSLVCLTV